MDDSDPKPDARPGHGWLRRQARALAIVAALLLLYTLAGFVLVPHLARNAIIQYVQKDMGRHVSLGPIRFNPFTFTVEVHQFALAEADNRPLVSFDLLRISASLGASIVHRAWTLSEVRLEQPLVHVLINPDGSLNLAKLAPPATGQKPPSQAQRMPAVRVIALGVHGGSVRFQDLSRREPFAATLAPIEFDLNDFRTAPSYESRYRFTALTGAGERLDWSGQFSVQPLGSSGEFAVTGLKASTIAAYLQNALPFALREGSVDVNGSYRFVATPATALSLTLPSIKVHALAIAPAAGAAAGGDSAPYITLPELAVANTSVALSERRVIIGQVTLQKAALRVWREADGSLNLQRLLAQPASASEPGHAAPVAAAAPWSIALDRLQIEDASVDAQDRSIKPAVAMRFGAIGLTVQDYSTTGNAPLKVDLRAGLGDSGHLQAQGTITLAPLSAALDVDLSELDLPVMQPYIAQATDMTLYRGRFGLKGHIVYAQEPAAKTPRLKVALAIDVANLATRDNVTNDDFVSWRSLHIDDLRYQLAPDALSIARIVVRAPYGRVIIGAKGGLNVADVLRSAGNQASAAAAPAAAPGAAKPGARSHETKVAATRAAPGMPMSIARVEVQGGVADFTDHSVTPMFSTAIYDLKGSVVGLSSDPASRATVTLEGNVDRYAPVSIKGQVNLLSAATYTDIAMSFSNIELTTFNPYSGKFAGYSIAQGKLTTEMQYHVENRKLDAKHHIVVDQLEFGDATESKQAVPLPIKLAVSLLKDRNGVINLDLPVGGSLDDPTFRIGPIIWKLFVGLVTKIVTAPFALLGSLFGGGPELSYIDFPAGVATLTPAQMQKLTQLSKALVERPQIKLDIPLHTQADDDDQALERAALEAALDATAAVPAGKHARPKADATVGSASAPAAARLAKLATLYRIRFQTDPQYPPEAASAAEPDTERAAWLEQQLLPQFAPTREQRDALAQARAQAVQAAVLANAELKPERVFLTNQVSGGGPDGSVRMELKLE
jgi:uncharacterized protein involved in outer membrane biogenesis